MARIAYYGLLCGLYRVAADLQIPFQLPDDFVRVDFESPEHWAIGDSATLRFPQTNITGASFNHHVQDGYNTSLSYGQILALAGDYYAHYTLTHCPSQISDDPANFLTATDYLTYAKNSFPWYTLSSLIKYISKQGAEAHNASDPAQEYDETYGYQDATNWGYNEQFWRVTNAGYLAIALCNWDHFGADARKAYATGHSYAMQAAVNPNVTAEEALDRAYFLEAFSGHFLTDMFSTGHLRAPRRKLHGWFGATEVLGLGLFTMDPWPADRCSQAMHDEDCANGLWVTNQLGESWVAYGDKQLTFKKSAENVKRVQAAVQAGVDEIWAAFNARKPLEGDYAALKMAPNLDLMDPSSNFQALFESRENTTENSTDLVFRGNPGVRNESVYLNLTSHQLTFDDWTDTYDTISSSGPWENLYTLNIDNFLPSMNMTQLRQANNTHLVINRYGPRVLQTDSWNMLSQTISASGFDECDEIEWWAAKKLAPGLFALNGHLNNIEVHMGIQDNEEGVKILWRDVVDGNCSQVQYGGFSSDTTDLAMIKLCNSAFELWVIPSDLSSPVRRDGTFPITFIPDTFNVIGNPQFPDPQGSFVAAGLDTTSNTFKWLFLGWSDSYKTLSLNITFEETTVDYPALTLLSLQSPAFMAPGFIRLSYGPGHGMPGALQIDILRPTSDQPIKFFSKQAFPITWNRQYASNYLHWSMQYLTPVAKFPALVAYLDSHINDDLIVLTFTYNETLPGFNKPIITHIESETVGKRFNGAFFTTLVVTDVYGAGIVEVMDYYGVLGVRMVGLNENTTGYEVQGQVPAVAGQLSSGLGSETLANGRDRAVGFFFEEAHYF